MDDLEFRRKILSDPHYRDADINQSIATDSAKYQFAQDIDVLDQQIKNALNVTVPDDLADKLILRQTLNNHQQHKNKRRWHMALAASVAITFGVALNFMMFSHSFKNLGDYAIAHTLHEADHFSNNETANVSLASLNYKMSTFKGKFNNLIGEVIFADYCRFDGTKSLHLVFQGQSSPVNVFIIPKDNDMKFTENFARDQLHGLSEKFDHSEVIIVGDKNEPLNQWQEKIKSNVNWSI